MDKYSNKSPNKFYEQLITEHDNDEHVLWCFARPYPRPCFTPQLLKDLLSFLSDTKKRVSVKSDIHSENNLRYLVLGSHLPGIFSLGGDLSLFVECIKNDDREKLSEYMKLSIDVLYNTYTNMNAPITTIAMIRGNALGAGFEGALACDYLVAERGVQLGFPEIIFNMFPGMGAYSFLARKVNPATVEKMILSGKIYTADELYEMGVVDVLAEKGKGENEVRKFIKQHAKTRNARETLMKIRNIVNPVSYSELISIGELWVDAAMSLGDKEIKVMHRLIRSQDKMVKSIEESLEYKLGA